MTKQQLIALFEYIAAYHLCSSETTPIKLTDFI